MAYEANTVVEMRVKTLVNTQYLMNVFHYKPVGNSTGFLIPDMVSGLLALETGGGNGTLTGELKKLLASLNTQIVQVDAQVIYPTRYRSITQFVSVAGTVLGTCNAQNVQACITKKGELANRANIGSCRIGGIAENQYASGLLLPGFKTLLQGFVDNWLLTPKSDGLSPVSYDPAILNKTPVDVGGKVKYVISGCTVYDQCEVHDQLRTQRTRNVGQGI